MKGKAPQKLLHKLLLEGASGKRMWASLIAMSVGLSLLLLAVLIWWNFNDLLHGKASADSLSSTFLTVSRRVTNENMGHPELTVFSATDIDALKHAPEVEDLALMQPVKERAYMSMEIAAGQGMSTIMVLEAVPDRFMDKRPADWGWQPGNINVPIILSSSFLSLYNYAFAPSQGLPQLSEESIKVLPFKLTIGGGGHESHYIAHVAGFSDRITSVLVPESFVRYSNESTTADLPDSRLIVKVKDPSSTAFAKFFESRGYVTNNEMLRWSKIRAIVQVVAAITGGLAVLLLAVSLLVFVLFIELTVARARHSVQLLQGIGYSPSALKRFLIKSFLPLLTGAVGVALILAILAQLLAHIMGTKSGLQFSIVPGWPMWICLGLVCVLLFIQMRTAIGKALARA